MKERVASFLEMMRGLLKYPVLFVLVVLTVILSIIQEVFQTNEWILIIQLIGIIIIAAFCAVILLTEKDGKKYINKIAVFSFFWFASCIVLVEFKEFDLQLLVRIITSYEYIFLGCLIPDFVSRVEKERDDTIKKLEERISILEENPSRLS